MTNPGLDELWRECAPRVLAALVRRFYDFDTAEDALQEALLAASTSWPSAGVPDNPTGWLITVAGRRLIDQLRSERARTDRELSLFHDAIPAGEVDDTDDSLTLLLLCCHPSLPRPAQVALTLRAIGGLNTAQIARAFLVPEATMAQRIVRAKARLRQVEAPFSMPPARELPDRVATVAHVLYLIFTEGHTMTVGTGLYDISLTAEAIRLTRQLHRQLPSAGEITGLLALMLLTDARRTARISDDGMLVPLAEQDRSRWDHTRIREGIALVEAVLPSGPVGPYQLQAAIAAVHAEAAHPEDTDWPQILALYAMLDKLIPSAVLTLNHAVAVAMVDGAPTGLSMLEPLLDDKQLRHNHRLYAVRGHLLELAGLPALARDAYVNAAHLATSIPEQRYLNAAIARISL